MNILVIGGNGFIGSHVVDRLILQGHTVKIYSRSLARYSNLAEYIVGDFLSESCLSEALIGVDLVVHSLSTMVPATSAVDPAADVKSNLLGTISLLGLMKVRKVPRLIYLSSGGTVYGNPYQNPVSEQAVLRPISSYGAVKVSIEAFISVAEADWGLSAVIFRPSNPFGERQDGESAQGLISTLLRCAIDRKPITIYGSGDGIRDYIYVKDLAELIALAVESNVSGVFNAGSGTGYSVNDIVRIVECATSLSIQKNYLPGRAFDVKEIVLDCGKAHDSFRWVSKTDIGLGVSKQFNYMMNSRSANFK